MSVILFLITGLIFFLCLFLGFRFRLFQFGKAIVLSVIVVGFLNILLSFLFSVLHVIDFNVKYLNAETIMGVPMEQILYSFSIALAFLTGYLLLNKFFTVKADRFSFSISNVLMGLSIAMIFFAYSKWYPLIIFSILLLSLFYIEYINTLRFMYAFYRAFVVMLILFLLLNVPLNFLEVLHYNQKETIELKLAFIPFESYFLFFATSLITVFIYERIKIKA